MKKRSSGERGRMAGSWRAQGNGDIREINEGKSRARNIKKINTSPFT